MVTLLCVAVVLPMDAGAHPGSGIVVDRAGNVYFVRAGEFVVYRRSPDGKVIKFVEDDIVRLPHHLFLGRDGTLYFASDFDGRVWRVSPDGKLTEHFNTNRIPAPSPVNVGSWGDPWTMDSVGNVYALAAPNGRAIVRISPTGVVTPIATNARFGELHFSSMTFGADGALYLTDANRVWRVVGDSATRIGVRSTPLENGAGVAVDSVGGIYVADYMALRVVRLMRDGSEATPPAIAGLRLSNPWGVTIAPDGSVFVLDHTAGGSGVAIWRVRGDNVERLYFARGARVYTATALIALITLLLALQTVMRVPSRRLDWMLWTIVAGAAIGGLWWLGRNLFLFEWLRHPILALFVFGVVRSGKRIMSRDA